MKRFDASLAAVLAVAFVSCGGPAAPATPAPVATPTPVVVATPTPAPAPTPEPSPAGEPPALDTKPARLTLRLFVVMDPTGAVFQYNETADGTPIVPVNFKFRLDVTAKDRKNKHTAGSGNVIWHWGDSNIIEVEKMTNIFHPTLRATKAGRFCATAELDEVRSNEVCLELRY